MAELATCANVSVKLGGMLNRGAALNFRELPTPPNSEAWSAAWRPYVEHHLWDRGGWTYLLPELLADLNTGHNIVATGFEECRSMYRANGPVEMRPVGEVEFVAGIAAMSASGGYGPIKVAQRIVGFADLALGDRVEPLLEALIRAGGGRLSGVRYSVGYG